MRQIFKCNFWFVFTALSFSEISKMFENKTGLILILLQHSPEFKRKYTQQRGVQILWTLRIDGKGLMKCGILIIFSD